MTTCCWDLVILIVSWISTWPWKCHLSIRMMIFMENLNIWTSPYKPISGALFLAHTFVWNELLYISLASTFGLAGGYHIVHNTWDYNTLNEGFSVGVTNNTKISVGFNNNAYYVGLSFVRYSVSQFIGTEGDWMTYWSGNIRFNVVKRFNLKRTIKILRPDLWIL